MALEKVDKADLIVLGGSRNFPMSKQSRSMNKLIFIVFMYNLYLSENLLHVKILSLTSSRLCPNTMQWH